MVVQWFALSPFFFHDAGARSGVGQGPIEYSLLEKLVEKILKPLGQIVPAARQPRAGWADAARDMHARGDDRLLDPPQSSGFDRKEWEW